MVDVNTIGAGGGSIAWLDGAGGLRVGPHSAGAEPGPACYGRGGAEATVTDASLVLGYLDPARFAGDLAIDGDAAWRAVERLARPLGLSVPETAHGIHRIVNARMADETRLVSISRGYDPRHFTLVLFGGGGPVSGCAVADDLGISRLLVPFAPGALSAFGLLVSRVEYDDALTVKVPADHAEPARLEEAFRRLDGRRARPHGPGRHRRRRGREHALGRHALRRASRYELEVPHRGAARRRRPPAGGGRLPRASTAASTATPATGRPVEFVEPADRSRHARRRPTMHVPAADAGRGSARRRRPCYFAQLGGFVETPVLDRRRAALRPGRSPGPAVIHQRDSTTVVASRLRAAASTARGNLVLGARGPSRCKVDPITLEVFRNRFDAIAQEMQDTLLAQRLLDHPEGRRRLLLRPLRAKRRDHRAGDLEPVPPGGLRARRGQHPGQATRPTAW